MPYQEELIAEPLESDVPQLKAIDGGVQEESPEEYVANRLSKPEDFVIDLRNIEIPDPESEIEVDRFFNNCVEVLRVCEQSAGATTVIKGRVFRSIRDFCKERGIGGTNLLGYVGKTFQQHSDPIVRGWKKPSKKVFYRCIQIANACDRCIEEEKLEEENLKGLTQETLEAFAQSSPEVQDIVCEEIAGGAKMTRLEVKALSDDYDATTSELVPDEVKEKMGDGSLSPRIVAPLVKEMERLPDSHLRHVQQELQQSPDVDTVKDLTKTAKDASQYLDMAGRVSCLENIDMEMALEESMRSGVLAAAAKALKEAVQLQELAAKAYLTHKRLETVCDRLYVDTGAGTPNLRAMLTAMESLTGEIVEVVLDDAKESVIRAKFTKQVDKNTP